MLWTGGVGCASVLAYWNARQLEEFVLTKACQHTARKANFSLEADSVKYSKGLIHLTNAKVKRDLAAAGPWSAYDLSFERIEVGLSLRRWLLGSGLVRTCSMHGIRGTIDRRHVLPHAKDDIIQHVHRVAFSLEQTTVDDLLLTVLSPGGFRPYTVSILQARLPRLRSDWLLLDWMSADSVVGMLDKSLFSLHSQQQQSVAAASRWRHFKIDSVRVDHVASGARGPLGWLDRGAIDGDTFFVIDEDRLRLRSELIFRDLHATAPSPILDSSFVQQALVRPLISYLNETRPYIKVRAETTIPLSSFAHGWSVYDTGLADAFSASVTTALVERVNEGQSLRRFGLWGLGRLLEVFFPA